MAHSVSDEKMPSNTVVLTSCSSISGRRAGRASSGVGQFSEWIGNGVTHEQISASLAHVAGSAGDRERTD